MRHSYKNFILSDLNNMEEILLSLFGKRDDIFLTESFNKFIELFMRINNKSGNYYLDVENIILRKQKRLKNSLIAFIESNFSGSEEHYEITLQSIRNHFDSWSSLVRHNLRYKILVFGINSLTFVINNVMDLNKAEIIGYIDDTGRYEVEYLNGIKVLEISDIVYISYDYIFSVSEYDTLVSKLQKSSFINERLIDYMFYKRLILGSPEFFIKHNKFLLSEKKYSGILTGLSYVQKGVNEQLLKGNFFNLAYPAQDIYYDFEMFKYAYSFEEVKEHIEYAIIGLSYYSFHYDLSLSINDFRVNYYYTVTKTMHNNKSKNLYISYHNQLKELEESILAENHLMKVFEMEKDYYKQQISDGYNKQYNPQERTDNEILKDIASIKRDFDKYYPLTVIENKKVLREYIEFLISKDIKPILVVCPTTKLYQTFTLREFQKELYAIINELKTDYNFQFLDYYYSDEFNDSDFYDVSHMNKKGADKLSAILNRDIVW